MNERESADNRKARGERQESDPQRNTRDLIAFLCEGLLPEATAPFARWIETSKRFAAFAADNRTKIRKKLRTARASESLQSVLLEMEVARFFVEDRRCEVAYERYGQGQGRHPDLTVTFRIHTEIDLEVTRLSPVGAAPSEREEKLIRVVGSKLGQMTPGNPNLLIVSPGSASLPVEEVASAMKRLKEEVEGHNAPLNRLGYVDRAAFFKQFQRLNGIVVWRSETEGPGAERSLWINPQAKRPLPAPFLALLKA